MLLQTHRIGSREQIPQELVESMVMIELHSDGRSLGCRSMQRRVRESFGVNVSRDAVGAAQRALDPVAVANRRKQRLTRREYSVAGPNALWHIDQNDKLRQFGFEIHGCIDGWSRKVMWLRMGRSNRLPEQILAYYLDTIERVGCMPECQRSDRGAENQLLAGVQRHFNGEQSHIFGRSVANQRIECWWNQMYAGGIEFWIEFFKDLERTGEYDTDDDYEYRCAIFVFADLLEDTLDKIFNDWNGHTMRKSSKNPGGVPDFLYAHPELDGGVESGVEVPVLLNAFCNTAFPGSDVDLDNLFGVLADRPVFTAALHLQGMLPITRGNMKDAFLFLRDRRCSITALLPA